MLLIEFLKLFDFSNYKEVKITIRQLQGIGENNEAILTIPDIFIFETNNDKEYYFNIINREYKEYKLIKFRIWNQLDEKTVIDRNSYGIETIHYNIINTPCLEIIVKKK